MVEVLMKELTNGKKQRKTFVFFDASPDQAYVINYLAYSWIEQGVKIEKSLEMLKK